MKIFLGHPFTGLLDNGEVSKRFKDRISSIMKLVEEKGHRISCALTREDYGKNLMDAETCTPLDFKEVMECDLFLCIPGKSGGVHIELGWASAFSKQIIIAIEKDVLYSPLVSGLSTITNTKLIEYETEEELIEEIKGELK